MTVQSNTEQAVSGLRSTSDRMIYFVQVDFGGEIGLSWVERDPARMDRKSTAADIADRQFGYIEQIIECNPVEHICSDVTSELMREAEALALQAAE